MFKIIYLSCIPLVRKVVLAYAGFSVDGKIFLPGISAETLVLIFMNYGRSVNVAAACVVSMSHY